MPSLHAADALIVGVVLFSVCRSLWAKARLGDLARVGLVRGDGDRQPLLARLHRRHRRRVADDGGGLQRADSPGVCRSSGVTDRLPTPRAGTRRGRCYGHTRDQSGRDQARLHDRGAHARVPLGHGPDPHPRHPERPDRERRAAVRRRVRARPLRGPQRARSSTGSPRSSSSPARCSTSSTARSRVRAARRRRSVRSSTRRPTA